ncbi:unnamed protein product [Bursaphelenchus xylophilus]|uniref:(pine wood nematode) hypothetical protein n=1 Tax=Bursaphelenchus xylophilus TaxID=6326 RepID=A0A1I7S3V9_BURXY|nr:unnamed protein product [Bursaphelenchus xylophilus]CAG9116530.1 unnamed protein product [Bursaphelenchus xylophilus]
MSHSSARKVHRADSRRSELLKHANCTLGSGSLREAVKLPQGEDLNEWIATNIVDFFNQISLLYGMISEVCSSESCPRMTAGGGVEYYWSDNGRSLSCTAPQYIDYLLSYVQDEMDDEHTFPSQIGKPFPPNFSQIAQTIMRRLFRIYAHVYHEHFDYIQKLKAVEHVNTSFKHFMLFVQEFRLILQEDQEPLNELIQELVPQRS